MKARTSGKSRLLFGLAAVLLLFLFALFHSSSQQQNEELRVAGQKCEQHEMALKAQFDAQAEDIAHLQHKLKSEKELRVKAAQDANQRLTSCEEAKAGCAASKKSLQKYEGRVNLLTIQLARAEKQEAASVAQWKFKYTELEKKFNKLEAAALKRSCPTTGHSPLPLATSSSSSASSISKSPSEVQRSFDEQVLVSENTYQIPIHLQSPGGQSTNLFQTSNRTMDLHRDLGAGIINSVENFQILPNNNNNENVLKEPAVEAVNSVQSSTATLNKSPAERLLAQALPLAPMAPEQSSSALPGTAAKARKIPDGVVPIPQSMDVLLSHHNEDRPSDIKTAKFSGLPAVPGQSAEQPVHFLQSNGNGEEEEIENGAHEVNDFNIVEDRNHHDHLQEVLEDEKIVINNNAAEVDAPVEDGGEKDQKRNEIDLASINRNRKENGPKHKKTGNEDFVADQGFDDHLEEHVEEEDDDEYPNLAAQQEEGPAVRN